MKKEFNVGDLVTVRFPGKNIDKGEVEDKVLCENYLYHCGETSQPAKNGMWYQISWAGPTECFHEDHVFPYQEPYGDFDEMINSLKLDSPCNA